MRTDKNSLRDFLFCLMFIIEGITFCFVYNIEHYIQQVQNVTPPPEATVEITSPLPETEHETESVVIEPIPTPATEPEEIQEPEETSIVLPDEPDTPAEQEQTQEPLPTIVPRPLTLADEIFTLTNKVRADNGLGRLTYADDLQGQADIRAKECSVKFSHTRPDGSDCHSIIHKDYYVAGENLIMADKPIATPERLMDEWMHSAGHRANILLPEFTEMAVGTYEKDGVVYAVQIFLG